MNNIVLSKISLLVLSIYCLYLCFFLIGKITMLLLPFLLGYLICHLITPAVDKLEKHFYLPRGLTSIILILSGIATFGYGLFWLITKLAQELLHASAQIPALSMQVTQLINAVTEQLESLQVLLPQALSQYLSTGLQSAFMKLGEVSTRIGSQILSTVTYIPGALFFIVVMFVSAFFMTKDKRHIDKFLISILDAPFTKNEKFLLIQRDVLGVLWGYIKAQLILMTLTFAQSAIGLFLIGIDYALPIALAIALIDVLPILGPAVVYMPWIISLLFSGRYHLAGYLFILYLFVTLARQVLTPKILSSQIGMHPLLTLVSMYFGLRLIGVWGIIFGPMIVIAIIALFKTGIIPKPNFIELK